MLSKFNPLNLQSWIMRKVHIVRGHGVVDLTKVFIDSVFASKKRAQKWCDYKNQGSKDYVYFVTTFDLV